MSTRYEGADARNTSAQHLAPGSWIGDVILGADEHALILGYDEVFYVTGTLDELRAFHARIGAALDREGVHECDEDEPCAVCDPHDCVACGMSSAECDRSYETTEELCCDVCTVGDTAVMHDPETGAICGAIYHETYGEDGETRREVCLREPYHRGDHGEDQS
jgi:hypothetical protein